MKFLLLLLPSLLIGFAINVSAQTGEIFGSLMDENNEPMTNAWVVFMKHGVHVDSVVTDFDGRYSVKPPGDGIYDLLLNYPGYQRKTITGVAVSSYKSIRVDGQLTTRDTTNTASWPRYNAHVPRRPPQRPLVEPEPALYKVRDVPKFNTPSRQRKSIFHRR